MSRSIRPTATGPIPTRVRWTDRWARRLIRKRLGGLKWGRITLDEDGRAECFGPPDGAGGPSVTVRIHNPRFYAAMAWGGSVAAAEAYVAGLWDCQELIELVEILARNRDVLERIEGPLAFLARPVRRLLHWHNRNTLAGSRANIAAHYDLGNDFYALWLDETMTYSAAVFDDAHASLAAAQRNKYARLCGMLELSDQDRLLEIGTGWGGLAEHAAGRIGCRVTTTTISAAQQDFAARRLAAAGLDDRVELLQRDYRQLDGTYDKLISIEMIEAVGHQYLDRFLQVCADRLRPGGRAAIQAITVPDDHYAAHVRTVDFIKRHIFPGSCLLSVGAIRDAGRRAGLELTRVEDIGPDYARTLTLWRDRFIARLDDVKALGFDEAFCRLWDYYLAYCAGAFAARYISDVQLLLVKT
jgi:cyclopropane-fatty-acyl-phospholipid synthase